MGAKKKKKLKLALGLDSSSERRAQAAENRGEKERSIQLVCQCEIEVAARCIEIALFNLDLLELYNYPDVPAPTRYCNDDPQSRQIPNVTAIIQGHQPFSVRTLSVLYKSAINCPVAICMSETALDARPSIPSVHCRN